MSDTRARRLTLVGGPDSGKSTWLGALLDALEAQRCPRLDIDSYPPDMAAIERLTEPLLDGEYPRRTEKGHLSKVDLGLTARHVDGREVAVSLSVQDYSGEELHDLFERRYGWGDSWRTRAGADAILLMIRAGALHPLPRLGSRVPASEVERWRALLQPGRVAAPPTRAPVPAVSPTQWLVEAPHTPALGPADPVRVPTSLTLIELLQFIRHARGLAPGERPPEGSLRVVVAVSAWDDLPPEWRRGGPGMYLAHQLPLLEDYLWSNFHGVDVWRVGLSATGGDLNDPRHRERYRDAPGGFVEWVGLDGTLQTSTDLSLPLLWAIFGEEAWRPV